MLPQRKFVKGLDASTPYNNQPVGTFPRSSNLVLTKRGALRAFSGSSTYSLNGGALLPSNSGEVIEDIFLLQVWGVTPYYIGIIVDPAGPTFKVCDITAVSYTFPTGAIGQLAQGGNAWPVGVLSCRPKMLQFNNQIIIYGSQGNSPFTWNGVISAGAWTANTVMSLGDFIVDGVTLNIQQVIAVTGDAKTGAVVPTFATNIGDTTTDNHVTWINRGLEVPSPITNSFIPVYPQWSPNQAFAAQAIIQVAFYSGALAGYWQANQTQASNNIIVDSNNNIQQVTAVTGNAQTGAGEPQWAVAMSSTTTDNNVTWTNQGPATFYNFTAIQGGTTGQGPQPPQFTDTVTSTVQDSNIIWQNTGLTSNSALPPRGAKYAIVYAGALWVGNTQAYTTADKSDGPTVLRMSDLNNPNSWNPINVAFIGKDDGTEITGLATFTIAETGITPTGSLVVFKDYATYQITGVFGASDFAVIQAQTDMGCVASDTIQFLPGYGIARLTHNGPAIFDGVRDRLFGEQIRPFIFGDDEEGDITPLTPGSIAYCYGAQTSFPPMYIMVGNVGNSNVRALNRMFLYDLVLRAWIIVDLPFAISMIRQIRQQGSGIALNVVMGGTWDGAVRYLGNNSPTQSSTNELWRDVVTAGDTVPVSSSLQTPSVYGKNTSDKITMRGIYVRGKLLNTGQMTIDIVMDTTKVTGMQPNYFLGNNNEFEAYLPFESEGKTVYAVIHATGAGEIHEINWDIEEGPTSPTVMA